MDARREVWVKIRARRGGTGPVARQSLLRWAIAVGSGAPVGWPSAELEREHTRELATDVR